MLGFLRHPNLRANHPTRAASVVFMVVFVLKISSWLDESAEERATLWRVSLQRVVRRGIPLDKDTDESAQINWS